jgi:hypothetical protein
VQVGDDADGPFGAHRLPHHRDAVGVRRQHGLESLDDHLVVVDQNDPHWPGHARCRFASRWAVMRITLEARRGGLGDFATSNPPYGGGRGV